MARTIRVSILGRIYPLRVEADDEAFTREVAAFVEERIRAVERAAPGHPDLTHVVVTSLALGEEVLMLRRELDAHRAALARTTQETDALTDRLDAALGTLAVGDGADPNSHSTAAVLPSTPDSDDAPPEPTDET